MKISYKKLWKLLIDLLLIDLEMSKGEFRRLANISSATSSKLNRSETVNTDILLRICTALKCDTSDIMEVGRTTPMKHRKARRKRINQRKE
jgi:DNA-binding Xre family transcriptional regulator